MGPMGMMHARFGPREGTSPTRDPEDGYRPALQRWASRLDRTGAPRDPG